MMFRRPIPLLLLLLAHHASAAQSQYRPLFPELWPGADLAASVARLSRALQFETVSVPPGDGDGGKRSDGLADPSQMRALHAHLRRSYPAVFPSAAAAAPSAGGRGLAWLQTLTGGGRADGPPPPADDDGGDAPSAPSVSVEALGCGGLSLLIAVRGSEHRSLRPVLLVSHLDVVPAPTAAEWTHPPFSGAVADGSVWGRGAIDVKGPAVALLEALQSLLAPPGGKEAPWRPARTVLVALGHDEEVGGACGARRIAAHLSSSRRDPAGPDGLLHVLWDEGAAVMADGVAPLVTRPAALVGTAEKRAVRVVARARAPGGHASMPPIPSAASRSRRRRWGVFSSPRAWRLWRRRQQQQPSGGAAATAATTTTVAPPPPKKQQSSDTGLTVGAALGRLLAAVDTTPPPAELRAPTTDMLLAAAPHADRLSLRLLLPLACRRAPALRPFLARALARASAGGASLVRTTVVATRVAVGGAAGGPGENVLPQTGEAVFNVRLLPGWGRRELRRYFADRVAEALGRGADGGDDDGDGDGDGQQQQQQQLEVLIGERGLERNINDEDEDEEDGSDAPAVAPSEGPAFDALRGAIERCWRFEKAEGPEGGGGGDGGSATRPPPSSSSSSSSSPSASSSTVPPLVLPSLLMGMTDSRHYRALVAPAAAGRGGGGGTLRFLPLGLARAELARIHGTDERVAVADFARAMCTYRWGVAALAALPRTEDEGGGGRAAEARGGGGGGRSAIRGGEL